MTQIPVRIKVTCASCHYVFRLSQDEYRELLKQSRVALTCPSCTNGFEYSPVDGMKPTRSPRPRRVEAETRPEAAAGRIADEAPPAAGPSSPAEFPPPPFAPLRGGAPAPPFAPLGDKPSTPAPDPRGTPAPMGGETKKMSLNDRWKQLPVWVQWTVIGVLIVVMAVIIFAIPTGGGSNGPAEPQPSRTLEPSRSDGDKKAADGETKTPPKTAHEERDSQERQP